MSKAALESSQSFQDSQSSQSFALVVHGGAGSISNEVISKDKAEEAKAALGEALNAGYLILSKGGSSLDAVEATVIVLEDCPVFNAGKGAVFNHEGKIELDASIMDGRTLNAGAVAGLTKTKNPILAARAVMEQSPHVFLMGQGANLFAEKQGIPIVDPEYFWTQERWDQLQSQLKEEISGSNIKPQKFGTVGAVALDMSGNLAAATSTGGTSNKQFGRVGDSPLIGAGTYAKNGVCAVSATGHGEFFIRHVVAYDITALIEYKGLTVTEAAIEVIHKKLAPAGGEGGVIAIDSQGKIAMEFNCEGMYRGWIKTDNKPYLAIFKD